MDILRNKKTKKQKAKQKKKTKQKTTNLPEAVSTFRHVGFFNHIKTDGAESKTKKITKMSFYVKQGRKVLLIQSSHLITLG